MQEFDYYKYDLEAVMQVSSAPLQSRSGAEQAQVFGSGAEWSSNMFETSGAERSTIFFSVLERRGAGHIFWCWSGAEHDIYFGVGAEQDIFLLLERSRTFFLVLKWSEAEQEIFLGL